MEFDPTSICEEAPPCTKMTSYRLDERYCRELAMVLRAGLAAAAVRNQDGVTHTRLAPWAPYRIDVLPRTSRRSHNHLRALDERRPTTPRSACYSFDQYVRWDAPRYLILYFDDELTEDVLTGKLLSLIDRLRYEWDARDV
jgi:hypothetical protein